MTSNVFPVSYKEPCFLLSSPRFDFPSRCFSKSHILFTTIISISSFIHSGHFYSAPSCPLLHRGALDYSTDTVSEFHAEAAQATAGKGLAQGPYVAARAGIEF